MTLLRHATLAGSLAAIIGALEAAAFTEDTRASAILFGAAIVGTAGSLLGASQALLVAAGSRLSSATGLSAAWRTAVSPSPEDGRGPVLAFHAGLAGALFALLTYTLSLWIIVPRILHIDDEVFAREFGVLLLAFSVVGSGLVGVFVARVSRPLVIGIDRRIGLPWPHVEATRLALWLGVPIGVFLIAYVKPNGEALGAFAVPFWLVGFLVLEATVLAGVRPFFKRRGLPARRIQISFLTGTAVLLASTAFLLPRDTANDWVGNGGALGTSTKVLRWIGDFDRDGYSAWLGGGDCSPLDESVNPGVRDLPDNGTDENCDGTDSVRSMTEKAPLFSGAFASSKKHNVVLVIVDAVRWDHTGMSGYRRDTTPYWDEVASESLVFRRAHAQSSATILSVPSILIGREPSALTWERSKRVEPSERELTLPERLEALGYDTALVADEYFDQFLERTRDSFAFHHIVRPTRDESEWFTGHSGRGIVSSIRYIEQHSEGPNPFFLTVYIPDPHANYDEHGFGISRFGTRTTGRYDGEIANADRHIGFLVEYLKYRDLWDDTIVIITSDHGEEFREHGGSQHARTCYVESTHVPLVVHIPGVEHAEIDHPVGLIDIVPTLLEVIGSTDATEGLDGQSLLVPALAPDLVEDERALPCAVLSQRVKQGNFLRRSLRAGKWLLVHDALQNRYELYDTEADSKEEKNVYETYRNEPPVAQLRERLNASLTGNLHENLLTD